MQIITNSMNSGRIRCGHTKVVPGSGKLLLYIPVIVLAVGLFAVIPVCAKETTVAVSNENPHEFWFISIEPIGNHYSGDTILIRGSTNISTTQNLLVEVYSSSYRHQTRIPFTEYGASKTVPILPGRDDTTNHWLAEITTTNWSEGEYLVKVSLENSTDSRPYATQLFDILPADSRSAENSLPGNATFPLLPVQVDTQVTPARTAVPTQTAPLLGIIPLAAIGGVLIIAGLKKDWGLK